MKANIFSRLLFFQVLGIFFMVSCSEKEAELKPPYDILETFPKSAELVGEKIELDSILFNPGSMICFDSLLIAFDYQSKQFLQVININTHKIVGNYGNIGNGPGEFITPFSVQKLDQKNFAIWDVFGKKMQAFSLPALLSENKYLPEVIMDFTKGEAGKIAINFQICSLANGLAIASGQYQTGRFSLWDVQNMQLLGMRFDYPKDGHYNQIGNQEKAMIYQGLFATNPTRDKFVFAVGDGAVLDIFRVTAADVELVKSIHAQYPNYEITESQKAISTGKSIKGITNICAGEKYIYALYSGETFLDYYEKKIYSNHIMVFDWESNPIAHFKVNLGLTTIGISDTEDILYGISNTPEPTLFQFNLKGLIQ